MAAPLSSYVYMVPLQQALFDKDGGGAVASGTGLFLAGGNVSFFSDFDRTIPKNVYIQDGTTSLHFTSVGSSLDLSIIGTFVNPNDGTNFVPFLWPFIGNPDTATDLDPEPYYITVKNSDGVEQFKVNHWPPEATSSGGGSTFRGPTVTKIVSGSGTYDLPSPAPLYLEVEMVGGGGGGAGSGTGAGSAAGTGGTTTFGTSLLTCVGGSGGSINALGGAGGAATVSFPAIGFGVTGGRGGVAGNVVLASPNQAILTGGAGGSSALGGAGGGGYLTTGAAGEANTGGGGGGAGITSVDGVAVFSGSGGGSGAYIKAIIKSPASTYSYSVGAGGSAGGAGAGGHAGSAGGSGLIVVTEYYQ